MRYLYVSSSSLLLVAVTLVCAIQNGISLANSNDAMDDVQWTKLIDSTEPKDLKKISERCHRSIKSFNEKIQKVKLSTNNKLIEPTTNLDELIADVKSQVESASTDIVAVRKLVQNVASRFKDGFKSTVSLTEIESELANNELETVQKTPVDKRNPLINRVIRSFGNRYNINKTTKEILQLPGSEMSKESDKKKDAKKKFSSVWSVLNKQAKTIDGDTLKTLNIFIQGMKSLKSLKKKVKELGDGAIDQIKEGDVLTNLRNAVEAAKALKLKFEDEWNLDSGELTYSQEQRAADNNKTDDKPSPQEGIQENMGNDDETDPVESENEENEPDVKDKRQMSSESDSPIVEQTLNLNAENENIKPNVDEEKEEEEQQQQDSIDNNSTSIINNSPIKEENSLNSDIEQKDNKPTQIDEVDNDSTENGSDSDNVDLSVKENASDTENEKKESINTPIGKSVNNRDKQLREKALLLPWEELIKQEDPQVSHGSEKCLETLKNTQNGFDTIQSSAKNSIQTAQKYKDLLKKESEIIKQYYNKMKDINENLSNSLIGASSDVCAKVTPINERYEKKFKNDQNIKRIRYLLSKKYDPNQYISKVLKKANNKPGIGGMKKTSYYKILSVGHNLKAETKEMDDVALYAMNKINEGKLAASNLKNTLNKEKVSKACYIRNILLEKENENDKQRKEENKIKVNESINDGNNEDPLKPNVNLDTVDKIEQPSVVDNDESKIKAENDSNKSNATSIPKKSDTQGFVNDENNTEKITKDNTNERNSNPNHEENQSTESDDSSNISQNQDENRNIIPENSSNNKPKHNSARKVTHHMRHKNPDDPNDQSEEYDTIEEVNEDESYSRENSPENIDETQKVNINTDNAAASDNNKSDTSKSPKYSAKLKNHKKKKDPITGKEVSEEYESNEEDINKSHGNENTNSPSIKHRKQKGSRPGEEKSDEYETIEYEDDSNPKDIEKYDATEKSPVTESLKDTELDQRTESDEHNLDREDSENKSEDNNYTNKPRKKRRNSKDPITGKDEFDELDGDKNNEDQSIDTNHEPNSKSAEESLETQEPSSEQVIKEKDTTPADIVQTNIEVDPKVKNHTKKRRKRKDPVTGSEVSEEYESDEDNNKTKEAQNNDESAQDNESDSNKNLRKRKGPKPGEEKQDEYETIEYEDDSKSKEIEKYDAIDKDSVPKSPKDIEHDQNTNSDEQSADNLNPSGTEKREIGPDNTVQKSSEGDLVQKRLNKDGKVNDPTTEDGSPEENDNREDDDDKSENKNHTNKPQNKRKKRKDPVTGKDVFNELDGNKIDEEESIDTDHETNLKSAERSLETQEPSSDQVIDSRDTTPADIVQTNTEVDPEVKNPKKRRKRKDPITGNEVSEEYESGEDDNETKEAQNNDESAEDNESDGNKNPSNKNNKNLRKRKGPKPGEEKQDGFETIEYEDDSKSNETEIDHANDKDSVPKSPKDIEHDQNTDSDEQSLDDLDPSGTETRDIGPDNSIQESSEGVLVPKTLNKDGKVNDPKAEDGLPEENESRDDDDAKSENNTNSTNKPQNKLKKRKYSVTGKNVFDELDGNENDENQSIVTDHEPNSKLTEKSLKTQDPSSEQVLDKKDTTPTDKVQTNTEADPEVKNHTKKRRKRKDPITGNEVFEEYESDEDDNKTKETQNNDDSAQDNESDGNEYPSNKNNKNLRKQKGPKPGEEKQNEYETIEYEDDSKSEETEKYDAIDKVSVTEGPKDIEHGQNTESDEHNLVREDGENRSEDNIYANMSPKKRRTRKYPITGKQIPDKLDSIKDDEDQSIDTDHETNLKSTEESLETQEPSSEQVIDSKDTAPADVVQTNTEIEPEVKNPKKRRKRKDPITGNEVSEEYESDENDNKTKEAQNNDESAQDNESDGNENPSNKNNKNLRKRKGPKPREEKQDGFETIEYKDGSKSKETEIDHANDKDSVPKSPKDIEHDQNTDSDEQSLDNLDPSGTETRDIGPDNSIQESSEGVLVLKKLNKDGKVNNPTAEDGLPEENEIRDDDDDKSENNNNSTHNPQNKRKKRKDSVTGNDVSDELDGNDYNDDKSIVTDHEPNSKSTEKSLEKQEPSSEQVIDSKDTTPADIVQTNTEVDPEVKNHTKKRRKRKDPITGNEISEEYESDEDGNETKEAQNNDESAYDNESDGNENLSNKNNKNLRKRKGPKPREEKQDEYETIEYEDDPKSNETEKYDSIVKVPVTESHKDNEHEENLQSIEHSSEDQEDLFKQDTDKSETKPNDLVQSNTEVSPRAENQLEKHRNRNDPIIGQKASEEYENDDEKEDNLDQDDEINDLDNRSRSNEQEGEMDNPPAIDQSRLSGESPELYEDENLDSVERAEHYGVENENIVPAVESYEESSTQYENSEDISGNENNLEIPANYVQFTPQTSDREKISESEPENDVKGKYLSSIETDNKRKRNNKRNKKPKSPNDTYDMQEDVDSYEEYSDEDNNNNTKRQNAKNIGDSYEELSLEDDNITNKIRPKGKNNRKIPKNRIKNTNVPSELEKQPEIPRMNDVENGIEQPGESKDNRTSDVPSYTDTISPDNTLDQENNSIRRPHQDKRHKTRNPKNNNEPETLDSENDLNNDQSDKPEAYEEIIPKRDNYSPENVPEMETKEPFNLENMEPQDESDNIENAVGSIDGKENNPAHRPQKGRHHKRTRKPKNSDINTNDPKSLIDENGPYDNSSDKPDSYEESVPDNDNYSPENVPETRNEPLDVEDNIEPQNESDEISDGRTDGQENNPAHIPQKGRRNKRTRKPKISSDINTNEPRSLNDENGLNDNPSDKPDSYEESVSDNDNYSPENVPETRNELLDVEDKIEPHDESVGFSDSGIDGEENNPAHRPHKGRRHKRTRKPKNNDINTNDPKSLIDENSLNDYPSDKPDSYEESVSDNDNYSPENVPETRNEPLDVEDKIEPHDESVGFSDSGIDGEENNPAHRPHKGRRHKRTREPKNSDIYTNDPKSLIDENGLNDYPSDKPEPYEESVPDNDNYSPENVPETRNEPLDVEDNIEPQNESDEISDGGTDDQENNLAHRPHKGRRHKRTRKPKISNNINTNEPRSLNDGNDLNDYPADKPETYDESIPNNANYSKENLPETLIEKPSDVENIVEPQDKSNDLEVSDVSASNFAAPDDIDGTENNSEHKPHKGRRHRRNRKPKNGDMNTKEPNTSYDENIGNTPVDDQDINNKINQNNEYDDVVSSPETNDKNDLTPEIENERTGSEIEEIETPDNIDYNNNVIKSPRSGKIVQRRNPKAFDDDEISEVPESHLMQNNNSTNNKENESPEITNDPNDLNNKIKNKKPRKKKQVRRKKITTTHTNKKKTTTEENNLHDSDSEKEETSPEQSEEQSQINKQKPKKKKHVRRIRTYMVNKATNEKIPVDDKTYSTGNGLPEETQEKESKLTDDQNNPEESHPDDSNANKDDSGFSSFLFKEHNSDQCKRSAYDKFKKVSSHDAKQIAYRSVLDISEMRSNMIATIRNAIVNVRASKTLNDVDQSLRTVSYTLKTSLKHTINDLMNKMASSAKDFIKEVEKKKELYQRGPQSTHKMLTGILESPPTVPDSAKPVLKLISPQFDVEELVNNIFDKPIRTKSLKRKRAKAEKKLIELSIRMETATSNIDCFVLTAMSTVGIGADTLNSLKSGRVIMSDKHPRAKTLRDAVGIIEAGRKMWSDANFTPEPVSSENADNSNEDDDEDPDNVTQKNEEFLKAVPDIDNNGKIHKRVPNRRQTLGVIVVHPDKQIDYKEVTDTRELNKFVGDQSKKYKIKSKNNPKILTVNSKKLIDSMVQEVKKKAEKNGMTKKEMVDEIIKNLKSNS